MGATLGEALRLGWTGLWRERWLVPVGLLIALLRRALAWPAVAVALLLLLRGAWQASRLAPYSSEAPLLGAVWVATNPRVVALVLGLAAAGLLLGGALRVLLLSGAVPTLAGAMGPQPGGGSRFAAGVTWGLPRLLPTALLGLALEGTGLFALVGAGLGALQISGVALGSGRVALAGVVAGALVLSLLGALLTAAVADAAMVRTALRGDGPVEAVLQASSRVLARPAPYLLAVLGFGALSLLAGATIQALGGLATGFSGHAPALLSLGPALMLGVGGMTVVSALELWWWASLAVLVAREG